MSEMEFRGQELLDKWISGEITYLQELELFELAEEDAMLKEALEGYIGQEVVFVEEKAPATVTVTPDNDKILKPVFVWRYAAAAVLVLGLISTFYLIENNAEGELADSFPFEEPALNVEVKQNEAEDANKPFAEDISIVYPTTEKKITSKEEVPKKVVLNDETENIFANNDVVETTEIVEVEVQKQSEPILKKQHLIEPDKILDSEIALSQATKNEFEGKEIIPEGMTKEDIAFFKSENNDLELKSEVRKEVLKDANREENITAYEIDIKSGVDPNQLHREVDLDSINQLNKISEINPSVVIASSNKKVIPQKMESDIVIKEYSIKKMDIIKPPIEDYHSLVRVKYKSKGNPSVGFLKYKHVLKESVSCLLDNYKNVAVLEEVSLKFKVHNNGDIEFLELFGINNQNCIESVSTTIEGGPSWELKDHYESIDVEVPFKVLYPYLF